MPASPQATSSMTTGRRTPEGSPKALATKSREYKPTRAASSMIGHGVSSRSSHSCAAGRITSFGEVVHPRLDLELVLVQVERKCGRGCSAFAVAVDVGVSRTKVVVMTVLLFELVVRRTSAR